MKQKRLGKRDKSEWLYVKTPRIISEELFEQAQVILRKNKQQQVGKKPSKSQYLLKGLLFCPCGWRMIGVTYRSGNGAYRCKRDVTRVERECDAPCLNQELVEGVVWDFIEGLLSDPEALLAGIEEVNRKAEEVNALFRERAEDLRAEIARADMRLANLLDLRIDGEIDKQTYERKRKEIEADTQDAKIELATTEAWLPNGPPMTEEEKAALVERCQALLGKYHETISFEDKRQMLLQLDVKVTHLPEKEAVRVEGAFPTEELSITS